MRADDDGFISSPLKILRIANCSEDDLKLLIVKGYIISFDSGVVVVTHWKMQNSIQKDRYKKTIYENEKSRLTISKNGTYTLMDTACIQNVTETESQDSTVKDSIVKVRLNQSINPSSDSIDRIDGLKNKSTYNDYIERIKDNISYDEITDMDYKMIKHGDKERIDEIIDVMVDMLYPEKPTVKIGSSEYPHEVVKSRLYKITSEHIIYIVDCLAKTTTEIKNMTAYLRTTIYTAPTTYNNYVTADVNNLMYG